MKRLTLLLFILLGINKSNQAQDLYDLNSVREITLKFYDANYHQTLIDWFLAGDDSRLPCTLEMDGVLYDSVAVRYKGNITFQIANDANSPKFPLNIDMNKHIKGQTLLGYKKLKLGNLFTDPTSIREAIAYSIYRDYLPAPRSNMIKINIGVVGGPASYYGIYSNSESIDKTYLKKHFDYKKGTLFKCDPYPEGAACNTSGLGNGTAEPDLVWYGPDSCQYYENYEVKTDHGWKELVEFMDVLNNDDAKLFDHLNIDRVLWHMATSTVIPNLDTYYGEFIHNYYLYKHKDGLWHMLAWDANEAFGGVMGGFTDVNNYDVLKWNSPQEPNRPLIWQILKHDRYYKQYFAHIRTILEERYQAADIRAKIDSIQDLIEADVFAGPHKRFPDSDFRANVDATVSHFNLFPFFQYTGIMPTVDARKSYLASHQEIIKTPPSILTTNQSIADPREGDEVWITAEAFDANQVDLMVTNNEHYASFFGAVEMFDDGLHNDGASNDGVYGALIPFQIEGDHVQYYVRAQNDDAMVLNPQKAEYEFFDYTILPADLTSSNSIKQSLFSVYPNPVNDYFSIVGHTEEIQSLQLVDVTGKMVYFSQQLKSNRVNVENLSNGVYTLKITTQTGEDIQRVVIR